MNFEITKLALYPNYKDIVLQPDGPREYAGILTKEGHSTYRPWLGFIELEFGKALAGTLPVKLEIHAYSPSSL